MRMAPVGDAEKFNGKAAGALRRLTLASGESYPSVMFHSTPVERNVLLSPDAGVWVRDLPKFIPPTRRSGWVSFLSAFAKLGARVGPTFELFNELNTRRQL